jgi:hypothetical protein
LLNAVVNLRAKHMRGKGRLAEYLAKLDSEPDFTREAAGPDAVFGVAYDHKKGAAIFKECDSSSSNAYCTCTSRKKVCTLTDF